MAKSAWYDINVRGRRLEAISKHMNTLFYNELKKGNTEMALAYLDRLLRIDVVIRPYVEQMTGVKDVLKKHEKEYATT